MQVSLQTLLEISKSMHQTFCYELYQWSTSLGIFSQNSNSATGSPSVPFLGTTLVLFPEYLNYSYQDNAFLVFRNHINAIGRTEVTQYQSKQLILSRATPKWREMDTTILERIRNETQNTTDTTAGAKWQKCLHIKTQRQTPQHLTLPVF